MQVGNNSWSNVFKQRRHNTKPIFIVYDSLRMNSLKKINNLNLYLKVLECYLNESAELKPDYLSRINKIYGYKKFIQFVRQLFGLFSFQYNHRKRDFNSKGLNFRPKHVNNTFLDDERLQALKHVVMTMRLFSRKDLMWN